MSHNYENRENKNFFYSNDDATYTAKEAMYANKRCIL